MAVTPYLFREALPSELEAAVNASLSTILNARVIGVEVDAVQIYPAYTKNVYLALTTDTEDANVITHPYVFKTFSAATDANARRLAYNFMAANPTYFFSPIFVVYRPAVTDPNDSTVVGFIYNTDSADGYSNWSYAGSGGGAPTGPAGGDLSGTYPNPTVIEGHITSTGTLVSRTLSERFAECYNIKDFGAVGDGVSHPLTAEDAAVINTMFAIYGTQGAFSIVAGDEKDFAGMQCALFKAAHTGKKVYAETGTYVINRPLALQWKTPNDNVNQPNRPAVCRIFGDGVKTIIKGYGITAGRSVFEMIGTSNQNAANIEFSDMIIEHDASCNVGAYCIEVGDAFCGWMMRRVVLRGANGALIRVSSSLSYSQLCTLWDQVQIWTNYDSQWGSQETTEVYAVQVESGGAFFDNVHFDSCFFDGSVQMRAHVFLATSCQFAVKSQRPVGTYGSNYNFAFYLGRASFDNCYFEDHKRAIFGYASQAPIESVTIRDCWFSGIQNHGGPDADYAVYIAPSLSYNVGTVIITGSSFRDEGYTISSIHTPGCPLIDWGNSRIGASYIGDSPTITGDSNSRTIRLKLDRTGASYNSLVFTSNMRPVIPLSVGPMEVEEDNVGQSSLMINNPNSGTGATAALRSKANGFEVRLVAFGPTHASLANQGWLNTTVAGAPIVLAPGGAQRVRVDDTEMLVSQSVNGPYSTRINNANSGNAARAFLEIGTTAVIRLISYGAGHASLANQLWVGSFSTNDLILAANGAEVARLDHTSRYLKTRNIARVGGVFFEQTASVVVAGTSAQTSIIGAGVGVTTMTAILAQGSSIEIEAGGFYSTDGAETITFEISIQGVVYVTKAISIGGAVSELGWCMNFRMAVRTSGAGGTAIGYAVITMGDLVFNVPMTATASLNTTATAAIAVSAKHSIGAAGKTLTCTNLVMKIGH